MMDDGPSPLRLHHVALRVADCETSRSFYAGLLGLVETRRSQGPNSLASVWLQTGEVVLMLEQRLRGSGAESGSGHLLSFAVDDLTKWEQRLAAAGVAIEDRTAHTLYLRDPDGHRVGLTTYSLSR
jgi:catechol 2,3-dioxygenase-like lactoylglutathione lyase family enzyme